MPKGSQTCAVRNFFMTEQTIAENFLELGK